MLSTDGDKKCSLSFNFDSTDDIVISVFLYVMQKEDPVHSITSQIAVTATRGGEAHFQHGPGINQTFSTEIACDFADPYFFTKEIIQDMYPLIIRFERVSKDKVIYRNL